MPLPFSLEELEEILVQLEPATLDSLLKRVKERRDRELKPKKDGLKLPRVQSGTQKIRSKHPYITRQKEVCGGRPNNSWYADYCECNYPVL